MLAPKSYDIIEHVVKLERLRLQYSVEAQLIRAIDMLRRAEIPDEIVQNKIVSILENLLGVLRIY